MAKRPMGKVVEASVGLALVIGGGIAAYNNYTLTEDLRGRDHEAIATKIVHFVGDQPHVFGIVMGPSLPGIQNDVPSTPDAAAADTYLLATELAVVGMAVGGILIKAS